METLQAVSFLTSDGISALTDDVPSVSCFPVRPVQFKHRRSFRNVRHHIYTTIAAPSMLV